MNTAIKKKENRSISERISEIMCVILMLFFITRSDTLAPILKEGIVFAYEKILPSIFPFMLLSGILITTDMPDKLCSLASAVLKRLKLNPYILTPCLFGFLCGFPVGAKIVKEYYQADKITKREADSLLPAANSPSAAFVISAVGTGLLDSTKAGLVIWLSSVISSMLLSLFLIPRHSSVSASLSYRCNNKYSFSESFAVSLKNASISTLNTCMLVAFFYMISTGLAESLASSKESYAVAVLSSILEIGSGCKNASALPLYSDVLCAFACGFGGMSAFFQVKSESHKDASMIQYLAVKSCAGVICAFFAFLVL